MGKDCRKASRLYSKFLKAVKLHNLENLTDVTEPVEKLFDLILEKESCERDKNVCTYLIPQPVDIYGCYGYKVCGTCGCGRCSC